MGPMGRTVGVVFACLLCLGGVVADIYLHAPRGSNNRLDEATATRTNPRRLFDSQNNNRGGYNVGDIGSQPAGKDQKNHYRMKYFQSGPLNTQSGDDGKSFLNIEWTNQQGCGGTGNNPQKQNCDLVLQYMCQDDVASPQGNRHSIRNGHQTYTQDYVQANKNNMNSDRKDAEVRLDRGMHEGWSWYNKCYLRERNQGLFVADQKLATTRNLGYSSAIHTRQNPTGGRYGYECPEERDYFPYWHPTPWVDIAVLSDSASMCNYYQSKSFNVQPYNECIQPNSAWSRYTTEKDCTDNGGRWLLLHSYLEKAQNLQTEAACTSTQTSGLTYLWAVAHDSSNGYRPECLVKLDAPTCSEAPWSRSNHLGNGIDGAPLSYKWTLPHFPSGNDKRCVFRMRYNISSDDYDPFTTDYKQNDNAAATSPIRQNPYVYYMNQVTPLRLAINTAQYGRVSQDRSHVFLLKSRKDGVEWQDTVHNLNVRGKRGNIVQTFPAVEYDFTPNELRIKQGDLVHVQWTGSNSHINRGLAGDGQTGAAGKGKTGSDRSNLVEMRDRSGNFPVPFENSTLWDAVEVAWIYHGKRELSTKDLAINMASSGFYQCAEQTKCQDEAVDKKAKLNDLLDNAPASYEGAALRFTKKGTYHFMCTRNNNFSNRSQKAAIVVE